MKMQEMCSFGSYARVTYNKHVVCCSSKFCNSLTVVNDKRQLLDKIMPLIENVVTWFVPTDNLVGF